MNEEQPNPGDTSEATQALELRAQQLPKTLAPTPELWSRVAQDLAIQPEAAQRQPTGFKWWAMAAGLVLSLGTALLLTVENSNNSGSDPNYADNQSVVAADPQLVAVQLPQVRQRLLTMLDAESTDLPPAVRETVLHNLEVIAAARQDIERALGVHPNDPLLRRLLIANYGNETNLLRNIETLTRQQQRRIQL